MHTPRCRPLFARPDCVRMFTEPRAVARRRCHRPHGHDEAASQGTAQNAVGRAAPVGGALRHRSDRLAVRGSLRRLPRASQSDPGNGRAVTTAYRLAQRLDFVDAAAVLGCHRVKDCTGGTRPA